MFTYFRNESILKTRNKQFWSTSVVLPTTPYYIVINVLVFHFERNNIEPDPVPRSHTTHNIL